MAHVVLIVIAVWLSLLALGPLLGATSGLTLALVLSGLVGWIAARIMPGELRRYRPARHVTPSLQGLAAPAELAQRRSFRMTARATVTNLALLLVSFLLGVLLCELTLRAIYPKYQGAAEDQYERNPILIWWRKKNSRGWFRNPDTDSYHPYHHNNLRMRQHRDFTVEDLDSATNIGFFGDSFLENQGMSSQYSLTEPLDYLLNLSNKRFNTLNFGVSSYGTGQSFLRYEHFQHAEALDYIFYVFTDNDLRNIYEHGLFHIDEAGKLARNEAIRSSWWTRNASSLHITYLLLDVSQRFPFIIQDVIAVLEEHLLRSNALQDLKEARNAKAGSPIAMDIERDFFEGRTENEHVENTIAIFLQLIERWRILAAERGSEFYIVLLPRPHEARLATILGDEFEVINLYDCFGDYIKDYQQLEWGFPYSFERDNHWSEAGNQLATVCLYRFLEQELGLPALSGEALREALFTYYSSFAGWMPEERWIKEVPVPSPVRDSIRDKYLALERHDAEAD